MKKMSKKQPKPLISLFGLKPGTGIPIVSNHDTSVWVDHDWMTLHFGRDEHQHEFVCATAGKHRFLLCATPPDGGLRRKSATNPRWVYLVDGLPAELRAPLSDSRALRYAGFKVTAGSEGPEMGGCCVGRDFVAVEMPGYQRTLLFRDPASRSTHAWTPRRAVGLTEAMELRAGETALDLHCRLTGLESTGDADPDALLEKLK